MARYCEHQAHPSALGLGLPRPHLRRDWRGLVPFAVRAAAQHGHLRSIMLHSPLLIQTRACDGGECRWASAVGAVQDLSDEARDEL